MENDYRNTMFCPKLEDINNKKEKLNEEITKEHTRAKIIYNQIKDKDNVYKVKFMKIYNYKCSYCGNSIDNISSNLLEIDHYICESSFKSKEVAGKIENLVLACYDCNRAKSNFLIKNKYKDILNPDLEKALEFILEHVKKKKKCSKKAKQKIEDQDLKKEEEE